MNFRLSTIKKLCDLLRKSSELKIKFLMKYLSKHSLCDLTNLCLSLDFTFENYDNIRELFANIQNGVEGCWNCSSSCQKAINSHQGTFSFGMLHNYQFPMKI